MSRDIPKTTPGRRPGATQPGRKAGPGNVSAPSRAPPTIVSRASAPAEVTAQKATVASTRLTRNNTGRVKFDDRGNAVWEWAVTTGSFGNNLSTDRLQKLDSQLSLADEHPSTRTALVKENAKGVVQGYSPYDSGLLVKETALPKKKTDLRRLGEWMKLRNQVNQKKTSDGGGDEE